MAKSGTKKAGCCPANKGTSCWNVESVIGVDERGQMILPKELRRKANIRPGDKLTVVTWEKDGKICCISMIKAEDFADMVRGMLGPMMHDMAKK